MTTPRRKVVRRLLPWIGAVLFSAAVVVIWREVRHLDIDRVKEALGAIPFWRFLVAGGLAATSYLLLSFYDVMALRYLKRSLSLFRTVFASFIGFVFNMNIGVSVVGGSAVRYRLYSGWGLGAFEVGKVVAFCALTTGVGMAAVIGVVLLLGDAPRGVDTWMPLSALRPIGGLLLAMVAGYLVACRLVQRPIRFGARELSLPGPGIANLQVLFGAAELLVSATILFMLFPEGDVSLPVFVGVYLVSLVTGWISHVPGGIGVFETTFLLCLPTSASQEIVLASVLAYRIVYLLIPFAVGAVLLGAHEIWVHRAGRMDE